ncbi:LOW QUALITY PROTEIN: hypothetical protein Cgig2_017878 [Carnegiea gigantea]|uniref:Uncharacterized protein n=1 Tax=Carnegiea gigantea TaxID=171969 RepID=A0A9Q1KZQ8_9CARY|nr:LOW QUALITY PROTEIN: hypothetical protein Cgig2_017878 [Carnegiea gigantea]
MIRLLVRFGDKATSKSLEVDFLIVDVPTAYNVIIRQLTLHKSTTLYNQNKNRKQNKRKQNEGAGTARWALHHPHALLPQKRRLQLLGGWRPRLRQPRRRRDKLDLLRIAALRGGPLALIHKVKVRHEILVIFKLADKGQPDLAEVPEGVGAALLVALLLGLDRISRGLLQLMLQPFLLSLTGLKVRLQSFAAPLVLRDEPLDSRRHSATAFTLRVKTSAIAISSSVTLGGSEAPGAAKSQDLTMSWRRESLTPGSALMKLAEGRGASSKAPLAAGVATPIVFEGVRCSCLAGVRSPNDRLPDCHGLTWLSIGPLLLPSRQAHSGPLSASDESAHTPYLLGLLSNKVLPLLLPPAFGVGRYLFRSGVSGLEDRQPHPRLICIKQTGSQLALGRLSTPRIILKNQNVGCGKEEVIGLNCLSHEPRNGPRFIILVYIELKVAGDPPLVDRRLPKRFRTGFPSFYHEARPIVKAIPPQVPSLLRSPLNGMNEVERPSRTSKAVQLTGRCKGTNVVPGSGHDLRGHQFGGNGDDSLAPTDKTPYTWRAAHSRWHPPQESRRNTRRAGDTTSRGPSCGFEQVGPPGNSDPSATISVTGGVLPLSLSTDLPGPNDASGEEELVEALSEDKLLEECPEEELDEPVPKEALELVEATLASGLD